MFIINKQNSQLLLTDSIRFIAVVKFCVALKFYKRITIVDNTIQIVQ